MHPPATGLILPIVVTCFTNWAVSMELITSHREMTNYFCIKWQEDIRTGSIYANREMRLSIPTPNAHCAASSASVGDGLPKVRIIKTRELQHWDWRYGRSTS